MRPRFLVACATAAAALTVGAGPAAKPKAKSPKAHEHGAATMDVAVDGTGIWISLEVPGDGIFGFEHQASTAADKDTVARAMKTLQDDAGTLFVLAAVRSGWGTVVQVG